MTKRTPVITQSLFLAAFFAVHLFTTDEEALKKFREASFARADGAVD